MTASSLPCFVQRRLRNGTGVLGHFRLSEVLGVGGMGVAISAQDLRPQRSVAINSLGIFP